MARLEENACVEDLRIAKEQLLQNSLTLCIVREGKVVFKATSHGISGFLNAMEGFEDQVEGASVADKVVGKAIALLCVYARVKAVYASTLSRGARKAFAEHSIHVEWDDLVETVLGTDKTETCPFEELAAGIADPVEAYVKLKALQNSLRRCQRK